MQKDNEFRVHVRRVFKRIFYVLLDRLKVLHAALIGGNNRDRVTFTRSTQLESSSIFREWAAA